MWVLQDKEGRYFKTYENYDHLTTDDLREAKTYNSKQDAKFSPAYRYEGSSFVPVEVEVTVKIKAA